MSEAMVPALDRLADIATVALSKPGLAPRHQEFFRDMRNALARAAELPDGPERIALLNAWGDYCDGWTP